MKPLSLIVCLLLFSSYGVSEDGGTEHRERQALAHLLQEINELFPLIERAKKLPSHNAKLKFEYNHLRHDLILIKQGIESHLINTPFEATRDVKPLRGDYQR